MRMTFDEMRALEARKRACRKPATHEESKLQQACVMYFRYQYQDCIIFAIPNGGKRDNREAGIMKAEGVMAGVADLQVLSADGRHMFIEMKTENGRQSADQVRFQKWCDEHGHKYVVCRSLDDFMREVDNFIYDKL